MNLKEFFKLDIRKIVIILILFIVFSFLFSHYRAICIEGGTTFGFPFNFYSYCNDAIAPDLIVGSPKFNITSFISNLVFWYLISVLLVFLYKNIKK